MTGNILIVDDERDLRESVGFALKWAGYRFQEAEDAREAMLRLSQETPDLILLDWMLPGMSGVDLARKLKTDRKFRSIPIIMLSARGEEMDKVTGLENGADDYVTKPFSPKELVARIQAVLRRFGEAKKELVESSGLYMDAKGRRVLAGAEPVKLGPMEFRLLHFLMNHEEEVFTRSQLLKSVWGPRISVGERTVDVHIRHIRKALEPWGHDAMIQTQRGVGYAFRPGEAI